jgi:hypothetical protein
MSSLSGGMGYGATRGRPTGNKQIAGYDQASLSKLSPEQQQLFSQLMGGSMGGVQAGLGNLSGLAAGDQSQFAQLEAPALRQFSQLQGNLASRFSAPGLGARKSSGFKNTSNAAAMDLAERLQGQRMGLQQSAIQQLLGLSGQLLGRDTTENFMVKSPWLSLAEAGIGAAGQIGGAYAGGGLGSAARGIP